MIYYYIDLLDTPECFIYFLETKINFISYKELEFFYSTD